MTLSDDPAVAARNALAARGIRSRSLVGCKIVTFERVHFTPIQFQHPVGEIGGNRQGIDAVADERHEGASLYVATRAPVSRIATTR